MPGISVLGQITSKIVNRTLHKVGLKKAYGDEFFDMIRKGSVAAADKVVPIVIDLVKPRSVADVGCGQAFWLGSFIRHGVTDVQGVDGDYVDRTKLDIPADRFASHDLNTRYNAPRRFDLAMSVECGEHIRPENTDALVDTMVGLAPVVMFSAALPYQGGRDHFNERWITSWMKRFEKRGYEPVDAVRGQIWNDKTIQWWYRQNIMVYVEKSARDRYPQLLAAGERFGFPEPAVVHPECYLQGIEWGWSRTKSHTTTYPGHDE
jgi:hypothetical protein